LDEESVSAVSVNGFKRRLQKLHTDGLFPRLCKPTEPFGLSQISGEALTGKILVRLITQVPKISASWSGVKSRMPNSRNAEQK